MKSGSRTQGGMSAVGLERRRSPGRAATDDRSWGEGVAALVPKGSCPVNAVGGAQSVKSSRADVRPAILLYRGRAGVPFSRSNASWRRSSLPRSPATARRLRIFGQRITQRLAGPEKARDSSAGVVTSTMMRPRQIRRIFFAELFRLVRVLWPILSGVLFAMVGPGLLIGYIERWRLDEALYFTFVTGLTIGYGDLTPRHVVSRLLAVMIGFAGIVLTGLLAAVSVEALRAATRKSTD